MKLPAYAKINLSLEALGRRSDGFHDVQTILQTISLADWLVIEPSPILEVRCSIPQLNGEANLVWASALALARSAGVTPGARIFIEKHIPAGMGLGGGSSDAAAALQALNQLWGLNLPLAELAEIAAGLGSDVPFFLWGGTALAQGRGEQITPLTSLPALPLTLVCPHDTIPNKTARLYSQLTPAHYTDGFVIRQVAQILGSAPFVSDMIYNVFEDVAFEVFPNLGKWRDRVVYEAGQFLRLSGAGPALFRLPTSETEHKRIIKVLQSTPLKAYLLNTVPAVEVRQG